MGEGEDKKDEGRPDAEALLKALDHRMRRKVLRAIDDQGRRTSPNRVANALELSLSSVSYHFRVLAGFGMLELVERRQNRGAFEHFYRPTDVVLTTPWIALVLKATGDVDSRPRSREKIT